MDTKFAIIPFSINREEIMEKLHIRPGSRFESKVEGNDRGSTRNSQAQDCL